MLITFGAFKTEHYLSAPDNYMIQRIGHRKKWPKQKPLLPNRGYEFLGHGGFKIRQSVNPYGMNSSGIYSKQTLDGPSLSDENTAKLSEYLQETIGRRPGKRITTKPVGDSIEVSTKYEMPNGELIDLGNSVLDFTKMAPAELGRWPQVNRMMDTELLGMHLTREFPRNYISIL